MEVLNNRRKDIQSWLFNPFIYVAGFRSLIVGFILMGLCAWVGFINSIHFDGVIDMHLSRQAPVYIFILELLIDWFSISIVLFVLGVTLSKSKIRWVDVFGTQALARWPMILAALSSLLMPDLKNINLSNLKNMNDFIIPTLIMLVFFIWFMTLMFNAYKISCNLKGTRLTVSFIGGLISAEILSKVLISSIVIGFMTSNEAISQSTKTEQEKIEIANNILTALQDKDYVRASIAFDTQMRTAVPVEAMENVWTSIITKSGAFKNTSGIEALNMGNHHKVSILCHFERSNCNMETIINGKNEVIGLLFKPEVVKTLTIETTEKDLKKYLGVYSSPSFPLKISISNNGNVLVGQAIGQPSFNLECYEVDKFKFDPAGLKLEFVPTNKMILLQGGGKYELTRE